MKIVFLTGAGVSKESGLRTFRDSEDGMWGEYSIDDVSSIKGWDKDKEQVIEFYTMRKQDSSGAEPNDAHKFIAELEKEHEVVVITQNIDNLHEDAGSTNVIHVHGDINEVRSTLDPKLIYTLQEVGCEDYIKIGSKCEKGSQLRPNIVWFGEMPFRLQESYNHVHTADLYVVVGTSFVVSTAQNITAFLKDGTPSIIVDPGEIGGMVKETFDVHIKEIASTGIKKIFD